MAKLSTDKLNQINKKIQSRNTGSAFANQKTKDAFFATKRKEPQAPKQPVNKDPLAIFKSPRSINDPLVQSPPRSGKTEAERAKAYNERIAKAKLTIAQNNSILAQRDVQHAAKGKEIPFTHKKVSGTDITSHPKLSNYGAYDDNEGTYKGGNGGGNPCHDSKGEFC